MGDGAWALGFVLLGAWVLVLSFAVAALYRLDAVGARTTLGRLAWPLGGLRPGDPLPTAISRRLTQARALIIVFSDDGPLAAAVVASVAAAAHHSGTEWLVSRGTPSRLGGTAVAPLEDSVEGAIWSAFQPRDLPTVCLVRDGQLVDAAAGALGPSQVARMLERFEMTPAADERFEATPAAGRRATSTPAHLTTGGARVQQ